MARTVAQAIADVRKATGDADADRDSDAEIRGYLVDALNIVKTRRPDLFIGAFADEYEELGEDDDLPLTGQYFLALVMYAVARVESKDDESADRARGELASKIAGGLLG